MLAITNPLGNLAIFTGLTSDKTEREKKQSTLKASIAIIIILIIVVWSGEYILKIFGLNIPAFETAGGLIILLMSLSMLHAKTSEIHHNQEENNEARSKSSIAVVPIATPIVAGPGAITTITINTHRYQDDIDKIYISGVCVIIAFTLWICFYFSSFFSRILGKSGINIATRIWA